MQRNNIIDHTEDDQSKEDQSNSYVEDDQIDHSEKSSVRRKRKKSETDSDNKKKRHKKDNVVISLDKKIQIKLDDGKKVTFLNNEKLMEVFYGKPESVPKKEWHEQRSFCQAYIFIDPLSEEIVYLKDRINEVVDVFRIKNVLFVKLNSFNVILRLYTNESSSTLKSKEILSNWINRKRIREFVFPIEDQKTGEITYRFLRELKDQVEKVMSISKSYHCFKLKGQNELFECVTQQTFNGRLRTYKSRLESLSGENNSKNVKLNAQNEVLEDTVVEEQKPSKKRKRKDSSVLVNKNNKHTSKRQKINDKKDRQDDESNYQSDNGDNPLDQHMTNNMTVEKKYSDYALTYKNLKFLSEKKILDIKCGKEIPVEDWSIATKRPFYFTDPKSNEVVLLKLHENDIAKVTEQGDSRHLVFRVYFKNGLIYRAMRAETERHYKEKYDKKTKEKPIKRWRKDKNFVCIVFDANEEPPKHRYLFLQELPDSVVKNVFYRGPYKDGDFFALINNVEIRIFQFNTIKRNKTLKSFLENSIENGTTNLEENNPANGKDQENDQDDQDIDSHEEPSYPTPLSLRREINNIQKGLSDESSSDNESSYQSDAELSYSTPLSLRRQINNKENRYSDKSNDQPDNSFFISAKENEEINLLDPPIHLLDSPLHLSPSPHNQNNEEDLKGQDIPTAEEDSLFIIDDLILPCNLNAKEDVSAYVPVGLQKNEFGTQENIERNNSSATLIATQLARHQMKETNLDHHIMSSYPPQPTKEYTSNSKNQNHDTSKSTVTNHVGSTEFNNKNITSSSRFFRGTYSTGSSDNKLVNNLSQNKQVDTNNPNDQDVNFKVR